MPRTTDGRSLFENDRDMLIRMDERLKDIDAKLEELRDTHIRNIDELKDDLKGHYVNKGEFSPVQKAVYAAIGFLLTGAVGAIITASLKIQMAGH